MIRQAKRFWHTIRAHIPFALTAMALLGCAALLYTPPYSPVASVSVSAIMQSPAVLSDIDLAAYKTAFNAQEEGDNDAADAAVAQLANTRLVGYLLAERYLGSKYTASKEELTQWLAQYSDHPQAAQIARLAAKFGIKSPAAHDDAPLKGDGYAENIGRSTMPDSWYRGLALWREKNYEAALPLFVTVGENEDVSDWVRSAGYYWAYRAATKLEQADVAEKHLANAAEFHTTFYGILAAEQTGNTTVLKAAAPRVPEHLRDNAQVIRAALLTQLGRNDEAEAELRHLYSDLETAQRPALVTLAHEMDLPNLQVRLGKLPQLSEAEALYARYPVPEFMVENKAPATNPALMLAIARNESSFREEAASGTGAIGMMQMLPSTASAIERRVGRDMLSTASSDTKDMAMRDRLSDPATSVRFGEAYINILKAQPAVGNNLVRVLAAYNAGPGTVSAWQSAARQVDDPLLYIESIPYPETHNYVVQVMAQYWVYQLLIGEKPVTLEQMAHGQWPQLGKTSPQAL